MAYGSKKPGGQGVSRPPSTGSPAPPSSDDSSKKEKTVAIIGTVSVREWTPGWKTMIEPAIGEV